MSLRCATQLQLCSGQSRIGGRHRREGVGGEGGALRPFQHCRSSAPRSSRAVFKFLRKKDW